MNLAEIYNSMPARFPELNGQVAVITGSGRGIGKGIAVRLGREGMKLVINDLEANLAEATASELRTLGLDTLAIQADVRQPDQIEELFDKTSSTFGTINLLVNNAAVSSEPSFFYTDQSVLNTHIETNIRGVYLCSLKAAMIMKQHYRSSIINISSVGALRAHWQRVSYDMTKGAVDAMTRAMALELSSVGIRVNAIAPGAIWTERTETFECSHVQAIPPRIPLKRFGTPYEVGGLVAFLTSSDADYITGQVIYLDGGITSQLHPPGLPI